MVIIIAEVDLEVDDQVLVDMVEEDRDLGTLDLEKVEMAQLVEQGVDMALVTMRIEGIATKRTSLVELSCQEAQALVYRPVRAWAAWRSQLPLTD